MGRTTYIPVTPAVLAWAIEESGLGPDEVAAKVGVEEDVLRSWVSGDSKPKLTDFRKLKNVLKRQGAFFLLPAPPARRGSYPRFRHPHGSDRTALSPKEIRYVRMAARLQTTVAWIARQLGGRPVAIPKVRADVDPPLAAATVRDWLDVSSELLDTWETVAQAQHGWRAVLEDAGVLVFLLPLGAGSCRGFSLWDDHAPVVAANTHWNYQARVFGLLHELGHLALRSNSACIGAGGLGMSHKDDKVERWCEKFAAAVLIPKPDLVAFLGCAESGLGLAGAKRVASRFKVSLRAAVLRLIDCGLAGWELWRQIPPLTDVKRGGGGGAGRRRVRIRRDWYGARTTDLLLSGMHDDLITRSDVVGQLNISDRDLDTLAEES